MKRATLTIAAVLAAWTLTAATVRTATETFVTNRIAIALQSATDYTDSAIAFEAGAATNYADSVAQAATNYTDSTAATLRDAIAGKADATNIYTKAEMDVAMNGLQRDIAHYGQIAENAVSSVNGKTGNAVTLDAKDIDILMVRGDVTTNIEYAVNGLDIEMGMTFDAIWRSISGKQDILPYATNAIPYAAISGKPTLAAVATSGSYNDLSNKPTIPTVPTNVSAFNNDAGYLTSYTETDPVWTAEKGGYATTNALAGKVPTSRTVNGKALTGDVTIGDTDIPYTGHGSQYYPTVGEGLSACSQTVASLPSPSDTLYTDGSGNVAKNNQAVDGLMIDFHPVAKLQSDQSWAPNHIVEFDSNGDLVDSGKSVADFATAGALSAAAGAATNYTDSALGAALAGKQDILPYATNAIPYAAITGKPTFATVATSGSYNDLTDKPTIPSPTAPVASATLAWQSNGSAIVVSVGAAGTLSATLTGWIEGQTQTALITIAAGASVSSEVKLVGYGTWPTGGQFLASATRVGNFVYVTPIVLVN